MHLLVRKASLTRVTAYSLQSIQANKQRFANPTYTQSDNYKWYLRMVPEVISWKFGRFS